MRPEKPPDELLDTPVESWGLSPFSFSTVSRRRCAISAAISDWNVKTGWTKNYCQKSIVNFYFEIITYEVSRIEKLTLLCNEAELICEIGFVNLDFLKIFLKDLVLVSLVEWRRI